MGKSSYLLQRMYLHVTKPEKEKNEHMTVEEKEKIETMHSGKKWQFSGHEKSLPQVGIEPRTSGLRTHLPNLT